MGLDLAVVWVVAIDNVQVDIVEAVVWVVVDLVVVVESAHTNNCQYHFP